VLHANPRKASDDAAGPDNVCTSASLSGLSPPLPETDDGRFETDQDRVHGASQDGCQVRTCQRRIKSRAAREICQ